MYINFLKYRKIYYCFSGILILSSLFFLLIYGLKPGIDFTGGSIIEIEFQEFSPSSQEIEKKLADLNLGKITIQPTGERGMILRLKSIDEASHQEILKKLGEVEDLRFETIGPIIGKELTRKTKIAVILALFSIIFYIAFAFRRLTWPVKSWHYSIAALIALFHDIIIPLGVFAVLGKIYNVEITIVFIAALLTILGYSINDTVVVFDRIRENILKRKFLSFEETVNQSLNQTIVRSVNTVLTVLFTLFAIYFFGGETLKYFSLVLIIGITSGMYSSIFIASPLMVSWVEWKEKRRKTRENLRF